MGRLGGVISPVEPFAREVFGFHLAIDNGMTALNI